MLPPALSELYAKYQFFTFNYNDNTYCILRLEIHKFCITICTQAPYYFIIIQTKIDCFFSNIYLIPVPYLDI
jgi:hypothetical protein